jgi:hypothetical protein
MGEHVEDVRLAVYGPDRIAMAHPFTAVPLGFSVATLWRLARGWYSGRLERGYRRREPAEAAEYFSSVGLRGPFWGLPE